MTVPAEYERASTQFDDDLVDARETAGLWSTHVSDTMTQAVFQVFRQRLSTGEAIAFANVLPVCLRALFVTEWNPAEEPREFQDRETMTREVHALRAAHNVSPQTAIRDVAHALRRHVDEVAFDHVLAPLPGGASDFWAR